MTPEQREKVKQLFEAALERAPTQRETFLTQACEDEEVRGEVKSLLSEHEGLGEFMHGPLLEETESLPLRHAAVSGIGDAALRKIEERYEVLREVGRGGMGIVYQARDRETSAVVALKVLRPEIAAEPRVVERFRQELLLARKVTHKNVCRTYELLRFGDAVVIAMEYVDGESLRDVLDRSSGVRLRRGLEWAGQVCEALAEAHAQGVVHRDLKPENILIDRSGEIKVMDFGIARSLEAAGTRTGAPMGTPAYMSPEQAEGKTVDGRSDIYSLGLVMYEMFTGGHAFHGEAPVVLLSKQINESPPPPGKVEPYLPGFLDQAIEKCLAKDPNERFQSVHEVRAALAEQESAQPAPRTRRLRSFAGTSAAFAAVAFLLFFLGKWVATQVAPSYHRLTFRRGTITSARFHQADQRVVYSAAWEGEVPQLFETSSDSESPESRPRQVGQYKAPHVLSISAKGQMLLVDENSKLLQMPVNEGAPHPLRDAEWADWDPDGTKYALVYEDANGSDRLDFPAGNKLYVTTGEISDARISPRGSLIAFIDHPIQGDDRGSVLVVDVNGNKRTLAGEYLNTQGLAWSPGGEEVWFTAGKTQRARALYAVTLSGSERLVLKTPGSLRLRDMSRDGRRLLLELADERGFIRGLFPGDTTERDLSWLDYSSAASSSTDLSPDGKKLLFDEQGEGGGAKHRVYLRQTDGSLPVWLGDGIAGGLSPNGNWALSILDTPPRSVALLATSTEESRNLPSGSVEKFNSAEWFPDNKRILISGSEPGHGLRCYVQDLVAGVPIPKTPEGTYDCIISPDAKLILAKGPKKKISLYQVLDGSPVPVPGVEPEDELIRFDKDGYHVYVYEEGESETEVYRLDTTNGRRELWRRIKLPDPAVDSVDLVLLTPDGRWYVCSYRRTASDLYLVEGLK
jgi:eukaryotic-like serine/threonine-protein kinase